jgi:hypothetical protein
MSSVALPYLEKNLRSILDRVRLGESLLVLDGTNEVALITPPVGLVGADGLLDKQPLVEFFLNSPLRDSGLEMDRSLSPERPSFEC